VSSHLPAIVYRPLSVACYLWTIKKIKSTFADYQPGYRFHHRDVKEEESPDSKGQHTG
jgi:hypothetical protein